MATGAIVVLNPLAQIQKARDATRKSDLSQIQKALETYYQDQGRYPEYEFSPPNYFIKTADANDSIKEWGTDWLPYMSTLPKDPSSPSRRYIYYSSNDGQTYYIYASLDRGASDPQACTGANNNNACPGPSGGSIDMQNACGSRCNYGVTSPNVSP